jgi:two-component system, OmpR family, phosphate regulon sensor histidine kinase PhoR
MEFQKTIQALQKELDHLRHQLEEANDTIDAIRSGQVDALVVKNEDGHQLYTLRSADQTYRVFIEKMKEGAITLNGEGLILYSNSRFANMMQLPLSSVIGRSFSEFVPAEDKQKFRALFEQGWMAESKGEMSLVSAENRISPYLVSLTTLELDEGIALSIIVTDLSAQKETERQLKNKNQQLQQAQLQLRQLNNELEERVRKRTTELSLSREHFKFLADHIPVIVWTAKPDGEIDYYNQRWYQYTGLTTEESAGEGWKNAVHPDDLNSTYHSWMNSIKTSKDFYHELRFRRASDNAYRWHSSIGLPFRNSEGEIISWYGICTDIQEQKEAMTRKDEFISMASHELKTPVTTLKAFTQMLIAMLDDKENPVAADSLVRMDKQINKLTNLIADLLDASKVNAGMLHFDKEAFDMNELVTEIVDQMQLTSLKHKIELQLNGKHTLSGDRNRLGQVLSNLIGNAIKYSPGANEIKVFTRTVTGAVQICVEDFGIGIPTDQQAKLFNRFFRASEVKTNTFPGLGLGLYISNEIVKRHSGSLTFTSHEGKGSVFCIELPVEEG